MENPRRPPPSAEGRFAKTPFAHVLLYIREHGLDGSLSIDGPANGPMAGEHFFVFQQGALTQAWLASGLDRFGDLLVDLKLVAAANRADAEVILSAQQALVGDVFLEMGLIDEEAIPRVLREQNKRRTQRIFTLGNANYRFYQNVDLLEGFGRERYALDVLGLVWRGVSVSPPNATIDQTLMKLGPNLVSLKDEASLGLFEFERDVDPLLAILKRGPVSAADLEALSSDRELARLLIYVLLTSKRADAIVVDPPDLDDEFPLPPPPVQPSLRPRSATPTPLTGLSRPMPTPPRATPSSPIGAVIPPPIAAPSATSSPSPSADRPSPQHSAGRQTPPTGSPTKSPTPSSQNTAAARPRATTSPPVAQSTPDFRKTVPTEPPHMAAEPQRIAPTTPTNAENAVADATKLLAALDNQTYFEMLGIEENATDEQLRSAFMKLASKWHPDRAPSAAARDVFQRVFGLINEAQLTLIDPKSRERYARIAKDGGGTPAAQKKVAQLLEASSLAQRAEIQLRRKDVVDAEKLAREAHALNPTDPSVLAILGLILFEKALPDQLAETITILTQAITLSPKNDKAQVTLAHALKRKGDLRKAIQHYKLALDANPKNVDAQREMRIAEMRARNPQPAAPEPAATASSKPKENEGLLSKFFKR